MLRVYHRWYSPSVGRDMELLVFGHSGARVLVFPTRCGRFYDFENFGLVESCRAAIENGRIQLWCVDSFDNQSVYARWLPPPDRMPAHARFERYVLDEVIPLSAERNPGGGLWTMGCSLGAWHAVNLAARHPQRFRRIIALSGRYDLTRCFGRYRDLFDGWYDDTIYFNLPSHYLPRLDSPDLIADLRHLRIDLACGNSDVIASNNHELADCLRSKGADLAFHQWDGEAHKAEAWRHMVAAYV